MKKTMETTEQAWNDNVKFLKILAERLVPDGVQNLERLRGRTSQLGRCSHRVGRGQLENGGSVKGVHDAGRQARCNLERLG